MGSPAWREATLVMNFCVNSSASDSWTRMRSADMQICPEFMNTLKVTALTA